MRDAGVVIDDIGMARPSLDDVFLTLTGHFTDPAAVQSKKAEVA